MAHPRFGTDGVRGEANLILTADAALALSRAAAAVLGGDRVVIGRDPRVSGPMLEAAMVAGYTGAGIDVLLVGEVPTPAIAWLAQTEGIPGVMISASHNSYEDNGIKLFASGGLKLPDDVEAQIETEFHRFLDGKAPELVAASAMGRVEYRPEAVDGWRQSILGSTSRRFDSMKVVVDCANGAASAHAGPIFEALGASVEVIGASPDGRNINAGVGSTCPEPLAGQVVAQRATLGLAFDGDADRLIAVDELGEVVDGDHILAILALAWSASGRLSSDTLVVTVMSNLGLRRAMAERGINIVETAVGDRHVLEALNHGRYSLGGEQSGHVICRDLATTGDGILAAVQLLDALDSSGRSLSELASSAMRTYPQVLRNVRLSGSAVDVVEQLQPAVAEAERVLGDDGRVLVRPSGTEPLVRVMVESIDADTADTVCARLVEAATRLAGAD